MWNLRDFYIFHSRNPRNRVQSAVATTLLKWFGISSVWDVGKIERPIKDRPFFKLLNLNLQDKLVYRFHMYSKLGLGSMVGVVILATHKIQKNTTAWYLIAWKCGPAASQSSDLYWTIFEPSEISEMVNFLKFSRPAAVCPEITSSASPSHSARMSLIFAVTRNVARAAGSSRSTRTWPSWGHWQWYRDIGMSQLPSHVSVKTLSPAIEIGIKNSFSCLNRVPKKFQPRVYHNAACIEASRWLPHLPSASSSGSSWTSQQKQQNKRKVLIRMHMYAIKWYFLGLSGPGQVWDTKIFQLFSALGHRYGNFIAVPFSSASWSGFLIASWSSWPAQTRTNTMQPRDELVLTCRLTIRLVWWARSSWRFDSTRKGKQTRDENMVHFRVTCFHAFSMQSQQQLSSGPWTFSTDFRSLSCLEVVSVTQVPRWGKLCWKSGGS